MPIQKITYLIFLLCFSIIRGNNLSSVTTINQVKPELRISDVTSSEDVIGNSIMTTISIDFPIAADVTFTVTTAPNSATPNLDYIPVNFNAAIPAGSTSIDISITIINDTEIENPEDFLITVNITSGNTQNTSDTASVTITDDDQSLDIRHIKSKSSKYSVFPNPSFGQFNLDLGLLNNVDISIYNLNGHLIQVKKALKSGIHNFDLPVGTYFLELKSAGLKQVTKLIVRP